MNELNMDRNRKIEIDKILKESEEKNESCY